MTIHLCLPYRPKHPTKVRKNSCLYIWRNNGCPMHSTRPSLMQPSSHLSIASTLTAIALCKTMTQNIHRHHDMLPIIWEWMGSTGGRHHQKARTVIPCIENLWHELKEFLRREIKPKTKQELIDGIQTFWKTVTIAKCGKYIGHLIISYRSDY